jgi:hypothetical protein
MLGQRPEKRPTTTASTLNQVTNRLLDPLEESPYGNSLRDQLIYRYRQ